MKKRWMAWVSIVGLLAIATTGCSGDKGGIDVALSDFKVIPAENSAAAGDLTFNATNESSQEHEFVIFKSDLAADQLPTNADGDVDEEGAGVTHIDEIEGIGEGETSSITLSLDAGNYVFICNLPGHYRQGMHVAFTVT